MAICNNSEDPGRLNSKASLQASGKWKKKMNQPVNKTTIISSIIIETTL